MNTKLIKLCIVLLFGFSISRLMAQAINLKVSNTTFTDSRDNNVYNWEKIGTQIWMTENLAYLPSVNMVKDGSEDTIGSYYYVYNYNGTNVKKAKKTKNYKTYGVLYNWNAAVCDTLNFKDSSSRIKGICPDGWHLPSNSEWTELMNYLGGDSIAGGKLKDTKSWKIPNTGATNEFRFTALPGGYRDSKGIFDFINNYGLWLSSSIDTAKDKVYYKIIYYDSKEIGSYSYDGNKSNAYSVRCLKN